MENVWDPTTQYWYQQNGHQMGEYHSLEWKYLILVHGALPWMGPYVIFLFGDNGTLTIGAGHQFVILGQFLAWIQHRLLKTPIGSRSSLVRIISTVIAFTFATVK